MRLHNTIRGKSGAPVEIRTPAPLLRRCAVQKSKCRFWCRLQGNASFISLLKWTEVGLKTADLRGLSVVSSARISLLPESGQRSASCENSIKAPRLVSRSPCGKVVSPFLENLVHHRNCDRSFA